MLSPLASFSHGSVAHTLTITSSVVAMANVSVPPATQLSLPAAAHRQRWQRSRGCEFESKQVSTCLRWTCRLSNVMTDMLMTVACWKEDKEKEALFHKEIP